ncbi:MAG TPA: histidine kinase [Streptosporangiaceae bacterium]|jgi:two-component system sensor histidine kinase DesK
MRKASGLPSDGTAGTVPPGVAAGAQNPPLTDDVEAQTDAFTRGRRQVLRVIITFFLVAPFFSKPRPTLEQIAFLAPATAALILLVCIYIVGNARPMRGYRALVLTVVIMVLAIAILAVGGLNWIGAIFIGGAGAGRLARSGRRAAVAAIAGAAAAIGVGLANGVNYGAALELTLGPVLAAFFAYTASRRIELVENLRETRAELARMAVADERLRIARDLHDLLGHSLSLITIKAELAGRVIGTDPDRAAREIADLETVARRSLGEVRAAVTSYRQPSLAGELAAARQMLAAAGMDCQVHAPASVDLAPEAEGLLAWTVREGVTNVVRHSGARTVTITVTVTDSAVTAEVTDDGVGPGLEASHGASSHGASSHGAADHEAADHGAAGHEAAGHEAAGHGRGEPGAGPPGAGLAGLAERARRAGAEISAGEGPGGKGFRLSVRVPADRASVA